MGDVRGLEWGREGRSTPGAMGLAAKRKRQRRKVGERSAEHAWHHTGAPGPGRPGARGSGAARGQPRGRSLSGARTARAESADTCGRRAGARRNGSPGARGTAKRARLFTGARGCYF